MKRTKEWHTVVGRCCREEGMNEVRGGIGFSFFPFLPFPLSSQFERASKIKKRFEILLLSSQPDIFSGDSSLNLKLENNLLHEQTKLSVLIGLYRSWSKVN